MTLRTGAPMSLPKLLAHWVLRGYLLNASNLPTTKKRFLWEKVQSTGWRQVGLSDVKIRFGAPQLQPTKTSWNLHLETTEHRASRTPVKTPPDIKHTHVCLRMRKSRACRGSCFVPRLSDDIATRDGHRMSHLKNRKSDRKRHYKNKAKNSLPGFSSAGFNRLSENRFNRF